VAEFGVGRRVLSLTEFDVVWRTLGLGAPPLVLQLPSPGRTHTERRRVEAEVRTALRERGLADVAGPEPGLDRFLRLLAAPSLKVEVRAWGALTVRAAMADAGDDGVLARRHDATVAVEASASIPGAVVGLLASSPAGPGRAATVPGTELKAALRRPSGAGLRADLVDRGVDRDQAGLMARMLHGIDGRAQIAVLVPDRWGVLHRSGGLMEVLDAPRGRYLMTRTQSADGTSWTSVAPVDDRRLRQRLAELLEQDGPLSPGRRAASVAGLPR
jgi:hypothetical protein